MHTHSSKLFVAVFAVASLLGSAARSEEQGTGTKLPDPVAATFKANFPAGEIIKVDAENEEGVTIYDFEFKDGDHEKETDIAADGTMLEWTLVIPIDSIPPAPMKTISRVAKGSKLGRLERIEVTYEPSDGKVAKLPKVEMRYAAEMSKGTKRAEIIVGADGKVVEAPEWIEAAATPAAAKTAK